MPFLMGVKGRVGYDDANNCNNKIIVKVHGDNHFDSVFTEIFHHQIAAVRNSIDVS